MKGLGTTSSKKIVAGIAAFAVLFLVLFSAFFICVEADHDCSGEDCPVCACIQMCETIIRQMIEKLVIAGLFCALAVFFLFLNRDEAAFFVQETPVSLKIRKNN